MKRSKTQMRTFDNTSKMATSLISLLILVSTSTGLANDVDGKMQGQKDDPPSPGQIVNPDNRVARFFHKVGAVLSGHGDSDDHPAVTPMATNGSQPAPAAPRKRTLTPLIKNDCLEVGQNEDYYPLYDMPDSQLRAKDDYPIAPEVKDLPLTLGLNGNSHDALIKSRGDGMDIADWPIVLHGPVRLCGNVNLQFLTTQAYFLMNRPDRLEIGPFVSIQGKKSISIVSSQLTYMEVTSNCSGKDDFNFKTPCIRMSYDVRTTLSNVVFIKHDGPRICRIDQVNITDVEARRPGYKKNDPIPCDRVPELPPPADEVQPPPMIAEPLPVVVPVVTNTTVVPVITQAASCDGPHRALILPTHVNPNFGLDPAGVPAAPRAPRRKVLPVVVVPSPVVPVVVVPARVPVVVQTIDPKTGKPIPRPQVQDKKQKKATQVAEVKAPSAPMPAPAPAPAPPPAPQPAQAPPPAPVVKAENLHAKKKKSAGAPPPAASAPPPKVAPAVANPQPVNSQAKTTAATVQAALTPEQIAQQASIDANAAFASAQAAATADHATPYNPNRQGK